MQMPLLIRSHDKAFNNCIVLYLKADISKGRNNYGVEAPFISVSSCLMQHISEQSCLRAMCYLIAFLLSWTSQLKACCMTSIYW